jgi:thioredoxin reductase (NADPH)
MKYDLIIVGAGPAGLTAAIYAKRRELNALVIGKTVGGQMGIAHEVENWPGNISISGFELAANMKAQAEKWGAEFVSAEVSTIEKSADGFNVKTDGGEYLADSIVLAFGLTPRDLGVPGEKELIGKGVSYCATCDGPFFKNKTVTVVGDGNSALEAVEYLSKLAAKIIMITKHPELKGEVVTVDFIKTLPNLEIKCCQQIQEINGEGKVEKLKLLDTNTQEVAEVATDGIFIEIGYAPKTGWLKGTVELNEKGEVMTDKLTKTSVDGIFAAGDCADTGFKQMIIAAGEGAKAALSAYKFIATKKGKVATPDWGKR